MPTLIEVIDSARNILNEPLDASRTYPDNTSGFWTDGILTNYHNLIQQEIAARLALVDETYFITQTGINIIANCAAYSLPSNFFKMIRVDDDRTSPPTEIEPITINEKDQWGRHLFLQSGSTFGTSYYIRGTEIVFDDTPTFTQNSAVRIHYVKRIPDVTAATSTSEIPAEYHRIIVWGMVSYALMQQQSENNFARIEYEKQLQRMEHESDDRQTQRPRHVKMVRRRIF